MTPKEIKKAGKNEREVVAHCVESLGGIVRDALYFYSVIEFS
jgi:hypothetical protein